MAPTLVKARSVCAATPPDTTCPVTGSIAICPAVNRRPFATIPCEYGPMAAGALSVWTVSIGIAFGWRKSCESRRSERSKREREETGGVRGRLGSDGRGIDGARGGEPVDREGQPRRLVALSAMRHGRKVWRVRLDEQTIVRNRAQQRVVLPLHERDDAAERNEPAD